MSIDILIRARDGNEAAFGELMQVWYKKIYNFSYRFFNESSAAEEATQNTFVQVYRKLNQLQKPETFGSWIYTIAHNECYNEGRKKTRILDIKDRWKSQLRVEQTFERTTERTLEQADKKAMVQQLLQAIPDNQRVVIVMKEYEGLTFREISEILEISENTAKARMYYGLKAMRKLLQEANIEKDQI